MTLQTLKDPIPDLREELDISLAESILQIDSSEDTGIFSNMHKSADVKTFSIS